MQAYVGITDQDWFELLRSLPQLDEVNFWQPSGNTIFKALNPGELFLFKLHHPLNYIVGGGIFAYSNILPISLAWDSFKEANGARSFSAMRNLVTRHRHHVASSSEDYKIGCILLEQPFFLPRESWIPVPADWKSNIVQGRRYDLTKEPGLSIWKALKFGVPASNMVWDEQRRYGEPVVVLPRLGQGSFRIMVTDAYERRCSITGERTLPALDAAHIIPFSEQGQHAVNNGILLRKDLHALFDQGYLTVTPSLSVKVSRRIKEEFDNGRDYYSLQGATIRTPANFSDQPSRDYLDWHNTRIFRG
jgi:putative restriction endonuclease